MPSRRIAKVNRAILETLSSAILFELRDPRVKNVTILNVETTDDLRACKVRVGVRGDVKTQSLTLHGLESARGFLQAKIAEDLDTRYTPILRFVLEPNWLDRLTETSHGFQVAAETAIPIDSRDATEFENFENAEQLSDETGIEDEEEMTDKTVNEQENNVDQDERTP
jgi:ribosome-binding factor A